ncbi:uncharacterized protein [Littorina saxatilis]|uniref:uncharacterized protein isoform X2 n=1 Tax=Littorina saxatilis TaxID=31220 RepID=UPI0038B56879
MPKKTTAKKTPPDLPAVKQRERRVQQEQGFYSDLLKVKGRTATPKRDDNNIKRRQAATRKVLAEPVSKEDNGKHKKGTPDRSKQRELPSTGAAAPTQDGQTEPEAQERKNVVAVVQDDTVSSAAVKGFLHGDSLPWEQSPVRMEQSEGQLTIKGTIEQVHRVLQRLAKIKSKAASVPPTAQECVAKVNAVSDVSAENSNKEGGQNVTTVYIKSNRGEDVPVTVEVPIPIPPVQKCSHNAAVNSTIVSTATENCEDAEAIGETVVYREAEENCVHTDEHNDNSIKNISCRSLGARGLFESRVSSKIIDGIPEKSNTQELINQLSMKTLTASRASVTESRDTESHNESQTRKGSHFVQTLPSSLPGILPLDSAVRCGLCHEELVKEQVAQHMEVIHASREKAVNCDVCSLVFPNKRRLLVHLKSTHEAANLTCQICGKQFQCQRYLRTHLQRHAGVKKFECLRCGWRFFERHKLKFHMELHKAESERSLPYRCELCGKQFANKATWSDHCNTHSGLRPFECHECGATFGHRVGLRRHKLTHEKVKPFSCNKCSKTFSLKPKLDEHMITHTGVSKHTCDICEKVFTAATSLRRHTLKCPAVSMLSTHTRTTTRIHTNTTPDTTPESDLSAVALDTLETQDSEQPVFLCGTCNACFATYEAAEKHTLIHLALEEQEGDDMEPQVSSQDAAVVASGNGVTSGERENEISASVEELKQIQLAASTLADLSTK